MDNPVETYVELHVPEAEITLQELATLGQKIDGATDAADVPMLEALSVHVGSLCEEGSKYGAYLWYFRGNIHAALQDIEDQRSWKWRQPHRERQILYLRRAIKLPTFGRLSKVMQASILVNLGNSFSSFGRGLEAINLYDNALKLIPNYGMALGNRGEAMCALLPSVPDPGHSRLLAAYAYQCLDATQSNDADWENGQPGRKPHYKAMADWIAGKIDPEKTRTAIPLDQFSLGTTNNEKQYRLWALRNNLFLNPLNVLGPHSIAARDSMNLPSYISAVGDPPEFIAWFNQMKQEFVTARWLLYEGTRPRKRHFADKEVHLINTLDYPVFSLQSEKLRTAFRLAFGLLDKIAGFVNAYYGLGMEPTRVDLRKVWYTRKGDLRPQFGDKKNLSLRGLYWLSQDIIGDDPGDQDSIAPEAAELKRLRNLLEHRTLVLREMEGQGSMGSVETLLFEDFERHAVHMVKLSRSALMYLAFSMTTEEEERHSSRDKLLPGMELPLL